MRGCCRADRSFFCVQYLALVVVAGSLTGSFNAAAGSWSSRRRPVKRTAQVAAPAEPKPSIIREEPAPIDQHATQLKLSKVAFSGELRIAYVAIQDSSYNDVIGRNDGFILENARFEADGEMSPSLTFRVSADGAKDVRDREFRTQGQLQFELKDAFIRWKWSPLFALRTGQFKAPFNAEELESTNDLKFIRRDVVTEGVIFGEGLSSPETENGLGPSRELGIQLETTEPLGNILDLYGAATNGNGDNQSLNDNDSLAVYGMGVLRFGRFSQFPITFDLGIGGFINPRTTGAPNDLTDETDKGLALSARFKTGGLQLDGSYIVTRADVLDLSTRTADGWKVAASFLFPGKIGFEPAVRYAVFDPNHDIETDALSYQTIGVNLYISQSTKFQANYTLTDEQQGQERKNNIFELLMQMQFGNPSD